LTSGGVGTTRGAGESLPAPGLSAASGILGEMARLAPILVLLVAGSVSSAQEAAEWETKLLGAWTGTRTASGAPDCPLTPNRLPVDKRPAELVWVRTPEGVAGGELLAEDLLERVRWTVVEEEEGRVGLQKASIVTCLAQERQIVALFEIESEHAGDRLVLVGEEAVCPALGCVYDVRYTLRRADE